MALQLHALLDLPQVPGLDEGVVAAGEEAVLEGGELDHAHAGVVLADRGGLVVGEAAVEVGHFHLRQREVR